MASKKATKTKFKNFVCRVALVTSRKNESIDDNLRQLVLIRQDRVLVNLSTCFFTSDSGIFFFFTFPKKWVGRAMGNEALYREDILGDVYPVQSLTAKVAVVFISYRRSPFRELFLR